MMERREFVAVLGGIAAAGRTHGHAWIGGSSYSPPAQPTLGPEVFARRLDRLRAELDRRKLDLFVAAPGTNFAYFAGADPGRSERLILLLVPTKGDPVIVAPSFEVERVKRAAAVGDVRGWEEQDDPWKLVGTVLRAVAPARKPAQGAIEATLDYGSALRLADVAGGGWRWQTAAPLTERLRVIRVRIEDDVLVTDDGIEVLSQRVAKL